MAFLKILKINILRRLPLVKYVYKFLSYCKYIGFKSAFKKVLEYFHRKKEYKPYIKNHSLSKMERQSQETTCFDRDIRFSILVPLYNTPKKFLVEMIDSVINQTYKNWELCMADGSDKHHSYVKETVKKLTIKDKRIRYRKLEKNLGISGNTNACIDMAAGDYIGLLDHDDLLHPSALFEVMKAIYEKNADFIYTDEDKVDKGTKNYFEPHFKPDFAIDNLRANNYICHFLTFQKSLLDKVGKFDPQYDGSQDHDITFKLTEKAKCIIHIPKVLYHWRATGGSTALDFHVKDYAKNTGIKAVQSHLDRCGLRARVTSISPLYPNAYRVIYELMREPLVSILILNKNHLVDLKKCISSILKQTRYSGYEIVIIENNSEEDETFNYYEEIKKYNNIRIVTFKGKFNFSEINNFGVKYTKGDYIILLNNDIEIISPSWIEEMLMLCQRPDIGAVGAKLYYYDDTIQHGGVILGIGGVAGHAHGCFPGKHPGYFFRLLIQQDLSAVTAACMMIKRAVFDEIDGFNPDFAVAFNDVDLCMRIRKAGYLIAWTPYAEAYHYESKSRDLEDLPKKQRHLRKEIELFNKLWTKELVAGDPYYNPNLTLEKDNLSFCVKDRR